MSAYRPGLTGFAVFGAGEAILRRCLSSMRPVVEEIIAVDTGAKDGARAVAEEFGARIYDMEWPGSFGDAYNFAIERVETEWTLWLDSDEWLAEGAGDMIREAIQNKGAYLYSLVRRDFWDDERFTEMYQARLWRTHPQLRVQGFIHAQFPPLAMKLASGGRHNLLLEARIFHDGFKGGVSEEKNRRNLDYIEKEMAARPGQVYFELSKADTLVALHDPEGAKIMNEVLDRYISSDSPTAPAPLLYAAIAASLDATPDEELTSIRVDRLVYLGWRWYWNNPPVLWSICLVEARRGNAFRQFHALLELESVGVAGADRSTSFNPEMFGRTLYVLLMRSAMILAKWRVAERAAKRVLEFEPENEEAKELLSDLAESPPPSAAPSLG